MPQVKNHTFLIAIVSALIIAVTGCSDSSTLSSSFDPDEGHSAGWLPSGHKAAAQDDINDCAECHGSNFSGGIARVSCTDCHLGDENNVHPLTWTSAFADHGPYVVANSPDSCGISVCHGVDFQGGGVGVSCDLCHATYPHASGWADLTLHGAAARNNILDCKVCHARSGTPPIYDGNGTGVDCQICHGTTASGAPHPARWLLSTPEHRFRIGDRTGCEECHTDIPNDPSCNFAGCHQGGGNLP
jgi:hypothetical protein